MNRIFMGIPALIIFPFSTLSFAQVETKPDRFTGETSYSTHQGPSLDNPLRPVTIVTVAQDGSLKSAAIMLNGAYKGWKYLSCHPTHWLLDGQPVQVAEAKHVGNVLQGGYVMETMLQTLSADQFAQFSKANKIEFKVCNDEGEFRTGERDDLRTIASKVTVGLK